MRPTLISSVSTADMLRVAASFGLSARELGTAAARAVNDVARTGQGQTRIQVRAHITLPAARVNDAINIISRATPQRLSATIALDHRARGQDRRPTLMSFKGRPSKPQPTRTKTGRRRKRKPFTYQVLKAGPRIDLPGGFVQTGQEFAGGNVKGNLRQAGRAQAFVRKGKGRYPLRVPRGPSVAAIWQNPTNQVAAPVLEQLNQRLPERIQGQAQRLYDQKWKKVST